MLKMMKNSLYKTVRSKLLDVCHFLEIVMSFLLVFVIAIEGARLLMQAGLVFNGVPIDTLETFIKGVMTIAIGVELVKMLAEHDASTIIEVLMFTIARKMVAEHGSTVDMLLGVIAIAILFATRKYLFIASDPSELK